MPRGLFAADEQIRSGCTDPRQAFEPCGMVEFAKNFYELGRISGKTLYADRAEDIMLNHFAASLSEDCCQTHYLTSANRPILSNTFDHPTRNGTVSHDRSYEMFTPNNRCCGHNTGMGWTWYTANLWQKASDGGLVAWLYAEGEAKVSTENGIFAVTEQTNYPFSGDVSITVTEAPEGKTLPLYFRIPRWSKGTKVKVVGREVYTCEESEGYICIENSWKKGDTVEIFFGVDITLTRWKNNGSVSVDRGPLTYSVRIGEEKRIVLQGEAKAYDHPEPYLFENFELLPITPWNYGLPADDMEISELVKVKEWKAPKGQPWSEKDAPIVLAAKAKRVEGWELQNNAPAELQQSPIFTDTQEEEIELTPSAVQDCVCPACLWSPRIVSQTHGKRCSPMYRPISVSEVLLSRIRSMRQNKRGCLTLLSVIHFEKTPCLLKNAIHHEPLSQKGRGFSFQTLKKIATYKMCIAVYNSTRTQRKSSVCVLQKEFCVL